MFGDGPKAITLYDPLKVNTELCVELDLVAQFAGGSVEEWNRKTFSERRMWVYYKVLLHEKERRHGEQATIDAKNKTEFEKNLPKVFNDRPGVRS
jgi:hypothetical protein